MRSIDSSILERVILKVQTPQNNNNPQMEVIVVRAVTGISRKEYWQEAVVSADESATVTSVAIRKTDKNPDRVYVSYVRSDGLLVVKSAQITYPITNMVFSVEETIESCVASAVEFNGVFEWVGRNVEYRTESAPWLFYTTTSGELYAGILGGQYEILAASGTSQMDTVRGIRSIYGDIDQGLIVFYVLNNNVYYRQLINGIWDGQQQVSIAPANAASIKAERLFDYRICLHVTDTSGALWEVFTKMEASGWNGAEYIGVSLSQSNAVLNIQSLYEQESEYVSVLLAQENQILYALSPVMVSAVNIDRGDGDYGYIIRITFDEKVFNPMPGFSLTDTGSGSFASTEATKISDKVIEVTFVNFNNATGNCTITYTPGTMTGEVVPIAAGSVVFTPINLVPFETEPPAPTSIEMIEDWGGSL